MLRKFDTTQFIKNKLDDTHEVHREFIEKLALIGKVYKTKTAKLHYWITLEVVRDKETLRVLFGRKIMDNGLPLVGVLHTKWNSITLGYSTEPTDVGDIDKYINDAFEIIKSKK